jgi:acetyl-CoA carboxylase biotin carboxyl carrier protein
MNAQSFMLRVRHIEGASQLLAPTVGIFAPSVAEGQLVSAEQDVGIIETLGVSRSLVVPSGVAGRVSARIGGPLARVPVAYGDALITLSAAEVADVSPSGPAGDADSSVPTFSAPMSGRFYGRPSPTEAPFISAGDTVTQGQTVGLLEVMKTFNRLVYQGDTLPEQALVTEIVPNDGDDVVRGDPILRLGLPQGD